MSGGPAMTVVGSLVAALGVATTWRGLVVVSPAAVASGFILCIVGGTMFVLGRGAPL